LPSPPDVPFCIPYELDYWVVLDEMDRCVNDRVLDWRGYTNITRFPSDPCPPPGVMPCHPGLEVTYVTAGQIVCPARVYTMAPGLYLQFHRPLPQPMGGAASTNSFLWDPEVASIVYGHLDPYNEALHSGDPVQRGMYVGSTLCDWETDPTRPYYSIPHTHIELRSREGVGRNWTDLWFSPWFAPLWEGREYSPVMQTPNQYNAILSQWTAWNQPFYAEQYFEAPAPEPTPLPPLLPIAIDGLGADWLAYSPVLTDPQGDTTGGAHTDLKAAFAVTDPNYLYIMIDAYDPPLVPEGASMLAVELKMDLMYAGGASERVGGQINWDGSFWTGLGGEWHQVPGVATGWQDVVEARIPFAGLGSPVEVRLFFVNLWRDLNGQFTGVDTMS